MAQPPTAPPPPGPIPPAAPGQPGPPPYPPPYPYYPPPPPRRTSNVVVIIVVVVVLVVIVTAVVAAVLYVLVSGLISNGGGGPPAIAFSVPTFLGGNATFDVAAASRAASIGSFTFRLEVNSARSPAEPFAASAVPQLASVAATTYQVTWIDRDGGGGLSNGDTVRVSGDGVPLGGGTYAFHLIWAPTGSEIVVLGWTV